MRFDRIFPYFRMFLVSHAPQVFLERGEDAIIEMEASKNLLHLNIQINLK